MTVTLRAWPDRAEAAIRAAIQRNERLFAAYPEMDQDDLFQEALIACRRAWPNYDPAKANWSTYLTLVTQRRLIDLERKLKRDRARGRVHHQDTIDRQGGSAFDDLDERLPLMDFVRGVYRQARHTVGRIPKGRGPRIYEPAQEAALIALKMRSKLSRRGVIALLSDNRAFATSLNFRHLPSQHKISRIWRRFAEPATNAKVLRRSQLAKNGQEWINEAEAATLIGLGQSTLKGLRLKGKCPITVYRPHGMVRYRRTDCDKYMQSVAQHPAATSTSKD